MNEIDETNRAVIDAELERAVNHLASLKPPPSAWTSEPPKVRPEGFGLQWYWWRIDAHATASIIREVRWSVRGAVVANLGCWELASTIGGQWQGPLEPKP